MSRIRTSLRLRMPMIYFAVMIKWRKNNLFGFTEKMTDLLFKSSVWKRKINRCFLLPRQIWFDIFYQIPYKSSRWRSEFDRKDKEYPLFTQYRLSIIYFMFVNIAAALSDYQHDTICLENGQILSFSKHAQLYGAKTTK